VRWLPRHCRVMSFVLKYEREAHAQVLVEFSNGLPKEGSEFRCERYQDKRQDNPRFRHHRKMLVHGPLLKYLGNNYSHKLTFPHAQRHVIAKINRRTGIARVYNTDFFRLSPLLHRDENLLSSDEENTRKKRNNQDERTFTEKQDDLTEAFGSHKRKRAMLSRQRNAVADSTAAVQRSVEGLMEQGELVIEEEEAADFQCIVPFVQDAKQVEDVYPLTKLIPDDVSQALRTEASKFLRPSKATLAQWKTEGGALSTAYLQEHAQYPAPALLKSEEIYEEYTCCLQLLAYLIRTYTIRNTEYRRRAVFTDMPEPVRDWLISEFFVVVDKEKRMPNRLKDKALAYGIIVAWHIDSFATNAVTLRNAYGITSKKLSTHVRALGGSVRVTTRDSVKVETAVLTLPLQFPRIQKTKRR